MSKTEAKYLVNSISDETVRYVLVEHLIHGVWQARKQVMTDGKWFTCWRSEDYPNQLGARNSIRHYLGV
jgi:hypothetical protein